MLQFRHSWNRFHFARCGPVRPPFATACAGDIHRNADAAHAAIGRLQQWRLRAELDLQRRPDHIDMRVRFAALPLPVLHQQRDVVTTDRQCDERSGALRTERAIYSTA